MTMIKLFCVDVIILLYSILSFQKINICKFHYISFFSINFFYIFLFAKQNANESLIH
jgi:hypothetical protein